MTVESLDDVQFVVLEQTGKYFICDQRNTDGANFGQAYGPFRNGYPYMLIHQGTVKQLGQVAEECKHFLERWARRPKFMFIVEARTRGQVKEFLVGEGLTTEFGGKMHWPGSQGTYRVTPRAKGPITEWINLDPLPEPLRFKPNPHTRHTHIKEQDMKIETAIESKKARIKQLKKEIKVLKNRPQEPVAENGMPNIIQFDKRFTRGGRLYEYAAIQVDGKWYTTGPRSPKGYTWDELVTWMYDGWRGSHDPIPDGIFVVTGLEEI